MPWELGVLSLFVPAVSVSCLLCRGRLGTVCPFYATSVSP